MRCETTMRQGKRTWTWDLLIVLICTAASAAEIRHLTYTPPEGTFVAEFLGAKGTAIVLKATDGEIYESRLAHP